MKTYGQSLMVAAVLGTLGTVGTARADDNNSASTPSDGSMAYAPYYRAQELSVDMFGSYTLQEHTLTHLSGDRVRRGQAGGGVGLNYFFCRYVGVGADTLTEGREDPFIYSASGNLILRIPIMHTGIAPYVFGGGGYQFDFARQDFAQGGAGIEFRITHHVGLFVDGRYVLPDQTRNYGLARAGLRISF